MNCDGIGTETLCKLHDVFHAAVHADSCRITQHALDDRHKTVVCMNNARETVRTTATKQYFAETWKERGGSVGKGKGSSKTYHSFSGRGLRVVLNLEKLVVS